MVRAAVKAYKRYASALNPDPSTLSPSTSYLRLLGTALRDDVTFGAWADPHTSIHLLELRAVWMVHNYAKHEDAPDASAPQRVSRAVSDAFVAAQVEMFIHELPSQMPDKDARVIKGLLTLVSVIYFKVRLQH